MSSGGLLQLVAFGSQDAYISGTPQITFWRVVYRRHTNFAMESMEQTLKRIGLKSSQPQLLGYVAGKTGISVSGTADFGRKVSCLVARNGDLIGNAYLQIDMPQLVANSGHQVAWTREVGHVLFDYVNIEIGGAIIDQHYGQWFTIYNELTQTEEKKDGYSVLIGNTAVMTTLASTIPATTIYIPLTNQRRKAACQSCSRQFLDKQYDSRVKPLQV